MGIVLVTGMFLITLIPYIIGVVLVGITFWLISTKSIKSRIAKILLIVTVFLFVFILIFNFNDERTDYLYREMKEISDNETLIGLSKEEVVNILGKPIDQYDSNKDKEVYCYDAGNLDKGIFWGNKALIFDCTYGCELRVVFNENDVVEYTSIHLTA